MQNLECRDRLALRLECLVKSLRRHLLAFSLHDKILFSVKLVRHGYAIPLIFDKLGNNRTDNVQLPFNRMRRTLSLPLRLLVKSQSAQTTLLPQ